MTAFKLTPREVVDAALQATKSSGKIQTAIREYIGERQADAGWTNRELGEAVADICSEYRHEIQPWVEGSADTEQDNEKQRKKAVLNQMNNVSKICKELIGQRIVAVKGTLGYVAEEYEAPTKSEESDKEPAEPSTPDTAESVNEFIDALKDCTNVTDCINRMMDLFGDHYVGTTTATVLKERKAKKEEDDGIAI